MLQSPFDGTGGTASADLCTSDDWHNAGTRSHVAPTRRAVPSHQSQDERSGRSSMVVFFVRPGDSAQMISHYQILPPPATVNYAASDRD